MSELLMVVKVVANKVFDWANMFKFILNVFVLITVIVTIFIVIFTEDSNKELKAKNMLQILCYLSQLYEIQPVQ